MAHIAGPGADLAAGRVVGQGSGVLVQSAISVVSTALIGIALLPALIQAFLDKPLPAFTVGPVRPGDSNGLSNTDFGKGEPMLLNVFASWCGPCRVEHPVLMRLKAEGGEQP